VFMAAVMIPGLVRNSLYLLKNPGGVVLHDEHSVFDILFLLYQF